MNPLPECDHGHRLDRTCVACGRIPTTPGRHARSAVRKASTVDKQCQLTAQEWEILTAIRSEGFTADLQGGIRFRWGKGGTRLAQMGIVEFGRLAWVHDSQARPVMRFVRLTDLGTRCLSHTLRESDPDIVSPTGMSLKAETDS